MLELSTLWEQALNAITSVHPLRDFPVYLDILAVAFLIYHTVRIMRETRAMQLVKGIAGIFALYFVAWLLQMNTLAFIIRYVVASGIVVIAVLFQPELRRALEQMGRSKIGLFDRRGGESYMVASTREMIDAVCESAAEMSAGNVGALMVLERQTKLGEIIKTGTMIDATASVSLITNIFFHNAPLHDGAMIIRDARLYAAGCFLPLSENMEIGRELGTRHRAALGMSENSDAVVVVVSEETGAITAALNGKLIRNLSVSSLKKILNSSLLPQTAGGNDASKKHGKRMKR